MVGRGRAKGVDRRAGDKGEEKGEEKLKGGWRGEEETAVEECGGGQREVEMSGGEGKMEECEI